MTRDNATNDDRMDRRKKTPFEYLNFSGAVGGGAISVFILQMVMQQNTILDNLIERTKENKESQKRTVVLLEDMRKEFKIDIQTFKLNHMRLEAEMQQFKTDQRSVNQRISEVERNTRSHSEWMELIESLKRWVRQNFVEKESGK